jgi:hypothetical protein
MNRRTLFQALVGSAAVAGMVDAKTMGVGSACQGCGSVSLKECECWDTYVPVIVGNLVDEVAPTQNKSRCYRVVAPKHRWYTR